MLELRRGDCMDVASGLPSLGDNSVDVVITDPPYSEHVHSKSRRGLRVTHSAGADDEIFARRELGFVSLSDELRDSVSKEFARICRRWVMVFCDVESSHLWRESLESHGLEYLRTGAWIKVGGAPQFTGDRPAVGFEAVVIAHRPGKKRWNGGGQQAVWSVPTAIDRTHSGTDARVHTAQKPIALMERLVRLFSEPSELICDPFAGSGTTGVACARLGRNFIGFEQDATYAEIARRRIANTHEQLEICA